MGTLEFKPIQLTTFKKTALKQGCILLHLPLFLKRKLAKFGGGKRDRTADLLHAMQALSQLSYTPDLHLKIVLNSRRRNIKGAQGNCQCVSCQFRMCLLLLWLLSARIALRFKFR